MLIRFFYKTIRGLIRKFLSFYDNYATSLLFYIHNTKHSDFITTGVPQLSISKSGKFILGKSFKLHNRHYANPIGRFTKCNFVVGENAILDIGNNVGVSFTSIVCMNRIKIGNGVKLGGGVCIYDTDFHSLIAENRIDKYCDKINTKTAPIYIGDNVFVGAHSVILKGVEIGENSIIGASSLVSKSVPANQIWAGNPIKFIKNI